MTKPIFLKAKAVSFALLLMSFYTYSQTCAVEKESLKGTYTGDCKKGKAHGKGKAVGIDTYEGDFKNGFPDGQGIYTWSNKNMFDGRYIKGLKDGKGTLTFRKDGVQDSVVEGYWKKDVYIGKHENPWEVISKTGSVTKVEVEYSPENTERIRIIVTNTTGGVSAIGGQLPQYKVDNVLVVKGFYDRKTSLESHLKSTETTLTDVTYPFRAKLQMTREEVEIEFFERGSYTVNISINN
jgi:hypothetical protein